MTIEFLREARLNYTNSSTPQIVDSIEKATGLDVSAAKSSSGYDIVYSKGGVRTRKYSIIILVHPNGKMDLFNATEADMTQYVGNKRWKAANDKRNADRAKEGLLDKQVGKFIRSYTNISQLSDKVLNMVGIEHALNELPAAAKEAFSQWGDNTIEDLVTLAVNELDMIEDEPEVYLMDEDDMTPGKMRKIQRELRAYIKKWDFNNTFNIR